MNYKITQKSLETLIENVLKEQYEPDKLYSREYVINSLRRGPRELKKYIKLLPSIDCMDGQGNDHICTKIPEVLHVYLTGRY